jgi:hypothetical protein
MFLSAGENNAKGSEWLAVEHFMKCFDHHTENYTRKSKDLSCDLTASGGRTILRL